MNFYFCSWSQAQTRKTSQRLINLVQAFEAELPFNCIEIKQMFAKIAQAEEACGVRGSVTLATLNDALSSQVWSELENADSLTSMVLLSSAFKNESTAEDCIDATNLRCFALLHCVGSPADKAQALYEILSGVGGV